MSANNNNGENKLWVGILIGIFIGLLLFGAKTRIANTGTIGGGEPCYYPTERQVDGICK